MNCVECGTRGCHENLDICFACMFSLLPTLDDAAWTAWKSAQVAAAQARFLAALAQDDYYSPRA
jgi:hypothetical protein